MLSVIKSKKKQYNTTAIGLWIKSGSLNDPKGKEGVHHFLEHIYFKDPKIMAAQEVLDNRGVLYNAFTSHELTCFLGQANVEDTSYLFDFLTEIATGELQLSEEDIEKEKKVIIEEINYYNSNPFEILKTLTLKAILGVDNPYSNEIYGSPKSLKNLTKVDIEYYLQQFHVNKLIVISGSLDDDSLVANINNSEKLTESEEIQAKNFPIMQNKGEMLWSKFIGKRDQLYYGVGIFIPSEYQHLSQSLMNKFYKKLNLSVREEKGLTYRIQQSSMNIEDGCAIIFLFQAHKDNLEILRLAVEKIWVQFLSSDKLEEELSMEVSILNKLNYIKADHPIGDMKRLAISNIFPRKLILNNKISFSSWLKTQKLSESILVTSNDIKLDSERYYESQ